MPEGKTIRSGSIKPGILYLDRREPSYMESLLAEHCTIPIEVCTLETGDFCCEDVVIERKTITDLAMSMMSKKTKSGRLWTQKERLLRDFAHKYVLVSGTWSDLTVNVHRHAILGAIARLMADGLGVCFGLEDDADLSYLVLKIFEKHGKLKLIPPSRKKKRKKRKRKKPDIFVGIIK